MAFHQNYEALLSEAPTNAWVLLGDDANFPRSADIKDSRREAKSGHFDFPWTTSRLTQRGDLLFFYFTKPKSAIHFVARATRDAYFDPRSRVNAKKKVSDAQWWATVSPLVEIEPIPFQFLQQAIGGRLVLRGKPGKYLPPAAVDALPTRATDSKQQAELGRIVVIPTGSPDLPDPMTTDLRAIKKVSPGAFTLEKHVSIHLVEPLVRIALGQASGIDLEPEFGIAKTSIGKKYVDYALVHEHVPVAAIEVKLLVQDPGDGNWRSTKEFEQLIWYTQHLGVPGMLVDARRIFLTDSEGRNEPRVIERSELTERDISTIRAHLLPKV